MNEQDARAHYNYLMTLCIRREEAFGPLALAFIRDQDGGVEALGPEEQFNLYMAIADAFPAEPRRYPQKLESLQKASQLLGRTRYANATLSRQLAEEIEQTSAELAIYNDAFRTAQASGAAPAADRQRIIVETDLPDYFLSIAPKRAASYYQEKYRLTDEAKAALNFKGPTRRFDPDNPSVQKDLPGACAPFMNVRMTGFHLMLPFDLKISRTPDDPLEAGMRIWYGKMGYSFPLRYEMGRLCSWYDGEVVDIALDDPNLLFVSASVVKEADLGVVHRPLPPDVPLEIGLPRSFLEGTDALGPYIQIGCNFKVWFDGNAVSLLTEGAPDLHELGIQGGAGLLTRSYAAEGVDAYAQVHRQPWPANLSFNFVNMHLQLQPGVETAVIPFNTPIFSVYPVFNRQQVIFEDSREWAKHQA